MSEPPEIVVTIQGDSEYTNGRYYALEIEHDLSDEDNPSLRIWLDPERPEVER